MLRFIRQSLVPILIVGLSSGVSAEPKYPPSGTWPTRLDGKLIGGTIAGIPFMFGKTDQDVLQTEVGPCADYIALIHPAVGRLQMDLEGETYKGTTNLDGATATMTLTPENPGRLTGTWDIRFPPHQIIWSIEMSLGSLPATDPSAGNGEIFPEVIDEEEVGVFAIETVNYGVALWNYDVDDPSLLPNHRSALDQAVSILQSESAPNSCESIFVLDTFTEVRGYASQTGPEARNAQLAFRRAKGVSDYLVSALGSDFFLTEYPEFFPLGVPDYVGAPGTPPVYAPGAELACNRSAEFGFRIERSFVDMYSSQEAQSWLRADLRAATELPENERVFAYRAAKGKYVMAENFRALISQGHCNPPPGSAPYIALKSSDDLKAALDRAYAEADQPSRNPYVVGLGSRGIKQANERNLQDPYYRATYASNVAARENAQMIEAQIVGEVSDWGCVEALPVRCTP